ncbi:MAG: adenylosuccinate synthase [Rickettsiaceae bacterium]|jgi:adenylosuccinate synthase|nr:adenylosuccinate synthase [Rickettsiaceae bacterium]
MVNTAIIGLQWGDEGKGKIVDFLSDHFSAVVRFQGGHNAGHTIKVGDKTYKLSLLPSGIVRGKFCVIGSGVVLDPIALFNEIEAVSKNGIKIDENNLNIADNTCLILSIHKELDQYLEEKKGSKKIGTTGRGIGPAYEDRVGRRSIRICDLFNDEVLRARLEDLLFYHNILRRGIDAPEINFDKIFDELKAVRDGLKKFSRPSFEIANKLRQTNQEIMFEGAQGALLDVSFGTYPFVTSSNTIAGAVATGSCLGVADLHKTLGILKAYTTRVGSGPFPTELDDEMGEFLRVEGGEVGTVTGRNRRCGWFDAALVRQSILLSSAKTVALTKLDVLDKLEKIKICVAYDIDGKRYNYFPLSIDLQSKIKPIYEEIEGWNCKTAGAKSLSDLPKKALDYVKKIEEICGVKVEIISTGAKREETIIVKN